MYYVHMVIINYSPHLKNKYVNVKLTAISIFSIKKYLFFSRLSFYVMQELQRICIEANALHFIQNNSTVASKIDLKFKLDWIMYEGKRPSDSQIHAFNV